jgi:hypothetical protein
MLLQIALEHMLLQIAHSNKFCEAAKCIIGTQYILCSTCFYCWSKQWYLASSKMHPNHSNSGSL